VLYIEQWQKEDEESGDWQIGYRARSVVMQEWREVEARRQVEELRDVSCNVILLLLSENSLQIGIARTRNGVERATTEHLRSKCDCEPLLSEVRVDQLS
jgi:hypothetical protein